MKTDVIIVGGGITGLACASRLAKTTDLEVMLIEARRPDDAEITKDFALCNTAITPASQVLFQSLGVWKTIVGERAAFFDKMFVWDGMSHGEIHFDAADMGQRCLGHIIENRVIEKALKQSLESYDHVKILSPAKVASLQNTKKGMSLTLEGGQRLQARLLIGADGAHSFVRDAVDIAINQRDYEHTAIVTNVRTEKPHDNTARQRFSSAGPLALLPLPDPHVCSIVWSQTPDEAARLLALKKADFNDAITRTFEGCLGRIELVSDKISFPLMRRHAEQYVKPHVALLGDAAHTIHPLAGQGLNLGLSDVVTLTDTIKRAHDKQRDFSSLASLRPFERAAKARAVTMLAAMDGFKALFASESPRIVHARTTGLRAVDRLPFLKDFFMRQAMG